jgi:DNA-binding NarL/FixJ family response regulator
MNKPLLKLLVVEEELVLDSTSSSDFRGLKDSLDLNFTVELKVASELSEANDLMDKWCPSVAILDAHSESVDCLTFIARWRGGPTPIVVTGAPSSKDLAMSVITSGASGYISKLGSEDCLEALFSKITALSIEERTRH